MNKSYLIAVGAIVAVVVLIGLLTHYHVWTGPVPAPKHDTAGFNHVLPPAPDDITLRVG